jgi:hypothetical protein
MWEGVGAGGDAGGSEGQGSAASVCVTELTGVSGGEA